MSPITRLRIDTLTLTGLALLSACSDGGGTEPGRSFEVEVESSTQFVALGGGSGELPGISCTVTLTATARGGSTAASWESGVLRLYAGLDRSEPIDSLMLAAIDVRSIMQSFTIAPGQQQSGGLIVTAPVPFTAQGEFGYEIDGEFGAAPVEFDCGPGIDPDVDTILPALSVSATPVAGTVEPGDTVVVTYEAESPIGLWITRVAVSGAVNDTFDIVEGFNQHVEHSVRVEIPPGTPGGLPFDIEVTTYDGVLRQDEVELELGTVVDRTPPAGDVWLTFDRAPCVLPACQFAPAQPFLVGFDVADNARLRWIIYEVGGLTRDSIAIDGTSYVHDIVVPRRPEWDGLRRVDVWLRDFAGNLSANLFGEEVNFIPALSGTHRAQPGGFWDVALDLANDRMYLLDHGTSIQVRSVSSLASLDVIPLPMTALQLDVSPDGTELVAALRDTLAVQVIDVSGGPVTSTIVPLVHPDSAMSLGGSLLMVRIGADGEWYVIQRGGGFHRLLHVERSGLVEFLATHDRALVALERTESRGDMVLSGNGCRALLSTILAHSWPGCTAGAALPYEPNASGSFWATRNAIFDASLQNVRSITLRDETWAGVISAVNGATAQLVGTGGFELLNASNGLSLGVLGHGHSDVHDVIVAAGGALVIAISTTDGVAVYDRR